MLEILKAWLVLRSTGRLVTFTSIIRERRRHPFLQSLLAVITRRRITCGNCKLDCLGLLETFLIRGTGIMVDGCAPTSTSSGLQELSISEDCVLEGYQASTKVTTMSLVMLHVRFSG
jgi:hypothetical protein